MSRYQEIVSIVTPVLLILCFVGIFTIAKSNLRVVEQRNADLNADLQAEFARFSKIQRGKLIDYEKAQRTSQKLLEAVKLAYDAILEDVAETRSLQLNLEQRLDRLETELLAKPDTLPTIEVDPYDLDVLAQMFESRQPESPVDLPERIRKQARSISAGVLRNWSLNRFLIELMERGVLPYDSPQQIPPELVFQIARLVAVFKANLSIIDYEEKSLTEEWIAVATDDLNFGEAPLDRGIAMPTKTYGPGEIAKSVERFFPELGVHREYEFSSKDYPELIALYAMRQYARDQLFKEILTASERVEAGSHYSTFRRVPSGRDR